MANQSKREDDRAVLQENNHLNRKIEAVDRFYLIRSKHEKDLPTLARLKSEQTVSHC